MPQELPTEVFTRAIEHYKGRVSRVTNHAEAIRYAQRLASERVVDRVPRVVADRRLQTGEPEPGPELVWFDVAEPGEREQARQLLLACDVGIGIADFALADTGQLALTSSGEWGRLLSLLSPHYVAVVREPRVIASFEMLLADPIEGAVLREAPAITLIAGCSASGDIEHVVKPGMHGPLELHVLITP